MRRNYALALLTTCILTLIALPAHAQLTEGFDNVAGLAGAGWIFKNNSQPTPGNDWFQGDSGIFAAQAGADDSYIGANFLSVADLNGNISNWLLTPTINFSNGDVVSFYSRTTDEDGVQFPDRLEVRLSLNGASTDVGTTDTNVGDFTTTLLTINPTLQPGAINYPTTFTLFSATLSGLPVGVNFGRVGFRYFVTDSGAGGSNGDYIGIDTLQIGAAATTPEPSVMAFIVLGGISGFGYRSFRRRTLFK